jgi:hypothetical protein
MNDRVYNMNGRVYKTPDDDDDWVSDQSIIILSSTLQTD